MALTQEQVDWWFSQNPNATADEVAAAVQAVGGLEGNAGLAGMIANRYSIAEPDVTNYYNAYVTPTTAATNTSTATDTILNTPTTETDLLTTLGTGNTGTATNAYFQANPDVAASFAANSYGMSADDFANFHWNNYGKTEGRVSPTGVPATTNVTTTTTNNTVDTTGNTAATDLITSGTPTTQAELLATLAAPADNITNNGYVKPSTQINQQYGAEVRPLEGDDIETQAAQLAEEYARWIRSADGRFMNFVRKDDGAILKQTPYTPGLSNSQLLKIGLSFVPGAAPFLAAYNALDAASRGDWTGAVIGGTGLVPGMENLNTALKVGQAIDQNNPFGAVTALAGNTDAQNLLGLGNVNVGGFTTKDIMAAGSLVQAANSNNTAGVLTHLGTLAGSSDTVLAGRALSLYNRVLNGDVKALGEAMSLSNSIASGSTGNTGSTTGANITTLSDEDLAELQPGELNAYQNGGVQGLADFRRDMRLLTGLTTSGRTGDDTGGGDITTTSTDVSGLPTGVQLASTGDGVFRTDVGGVPTYAESSNASSVKAPLGYTLLSMSESDDKPEGSYYDITANAWFKPDTAVTNLTGSTTIQADTDLFNNSIGTLDQLDTTRTADEFADFLATIGITNATQLTDSGLSNQDILNLINALDDTVTVTGATGNDTVTGATSNDTITGATGNDNLETVTVTGARGNDTVTGVDTIAGGDGNDGIPTVVVEACKDGKVRDPITGQCVFPEDIPEVVVEACKDGKVRDPITGQCVFPEDIPEVVVEACKDGKVRDPITGECVLPKEEDCPEGFERDEATGKCIPVVTVVDKTCPTGQVYDEDLKKCVPITTDECETGYEKVNGTCVPVCKEGFERDEATGQCIPVVTIIDTKCPTGQVYDEELKKCVPIKTDECAEGFHKDATGLCVPDDDEECKDGYEKVNGTCVPVCKEGYIRNLETGVCEKVEKECPPGQVRNADGKCVPIKKTEECKPGFERVNGVCVPVCQTGYKRVNGVCKKITADTVIPTPTTSGLSAQGEKIDPIYAGAMDDFDLFATLEELLKDNPEPKKDNKKSKDKTKMATGGHLDDLLAEQMTVDDLLKLLR